MQLPTSAMLATQSPNYELERSMNQLWESALSPNTLVAYRSAINCFVTFMLMQGVCCSSTSLQPVGEDIFLLFITHCQSGLKLKYATIKLYLAGVRFYYIRNNLCDPFLNCLRVPYILRAVKRNQVNVSMPRLPITFNVLSGLCSVLETGMIDTFTDLMLLCIFKLAFYGFLRCGEFTCKSHQASSFLALGNVSIISDLESFILTLPRSKTDPFRKGVKITIFENNVLFPVISMQKYIAARRLQGAISSSPLFVESGTNVKPLTRGSFIAYLNQTLLRLGYKGQAFNGHSFRIGAATSAATAGVEDHVIQTLGRWSSDCFIRYIRTAPSTISHAQLKMSA